MKTFNLNGVITISISTKVEAETLEDAIRISKRRHVEMSNYNDQEQQLDCWVADDFDGEPYKIMENNE